MAAGYSAAMRRQNSAARRGRPPRGFTPSAPRRSVRILETTWECSDGSKRDPTDPRGSDQCKSW